MDLRREAEAIFLPVMAERLKRICTVFNQEIAKQIDIETIAEGSLYHRIFHELIYPFFEGADVVRRAFEKPRGYAGDFEMMNQIYRNGFEGKTLFGRMLHHYITNENSAESVKFRRPYFINHYRELLKSSGDKEVLSVACGPAVEVQEFVRTTQDEDLRRLRISLFDLDRQALEHAQTKIYEAAMETEKLVRVTLINASVKAFLTASAEKGTTFDMIYSGGLFDYLDNTTASALVRRFSGMLKPDGKLVIGNFTKNNLTKAFLHLLTNWTLIHRTDEEMRGWATGVTDCSIDIEYDALKMNAFLVLRKHAPTH
jgi:SAM-dependent methyltransferase